MTLPWIRDEWVPSRMIVFYTLCHRKGAFYGYEE